MTQKSFKNYTADELVTAYEKIVLEQNTTFLNDDFEKFKKQYWYRETIVDELRARPGDQRELLVPLLDRREPWLRICAARDTYSLNPERARKYMQTIVDYPFDPYRGEAASALGSWDRGHTPR